MANVPIFGEHLQGVQTITRPGTYALMTNADSELALVEHQRNYRLPGGGSEPGESLEISLTRELREEPSLQILVDKQLWFAIQHVVADGGIHYELRPTYFSDTRIANIEETSKQPLCG